MYTYMHSCEDTNRHTYIQSYVIHTHTAGWHYQDSFRKNTMRIYMYIYIYIYTHTHINIYTYIHAGWHYQRSFQKTPCTYTSYLYVYIYIYTYPHRYMQVDDIKEAFRKRHVHIHHTYIRTYIHTCRSMISKKLSENVMHI
jgi:hypothetical protein